MLSMPEIRVLPKRWRLFNNSGEHSSGRVRPARCKLDRTQGGDEQASLIMRLAAYARASLNRSVICSQERASALAS